MKFKTLKLKNWKPFKGEQKVEFPQSTANIIIFFGENMHGKTSLLDAIRWCFFGEIRGQLGKFISEDELFNFTALQDGETEMYVDINFEIDGKLYELSRNLKYHKKNFSPTPYLKIDTKAIPGDAIEREIEKIIPKRLANFFLFDGELLSTYQGLVADEPSNQAKEISSNIERILGLPILEKGKNDIGKVIRSYTDEMTKTHRIKESDRKLINKLNDLEISREKEKKDSENFSNLINENNNKISELKKQIDDERGIIEKNAQKEKLEELITTLEENEIENKNKLKEKMSHAWELPIQLFFKPIVDDIDKQRSKIGNISSAQRNEAFILKTLQDAFDDGTCKICDQLIAETYKAHIKKKIDELKTSHPTSKDDISTWNSLDKEYSEIKPLSVCPISLEEIEQLNKTIAKDTQDIIVNKNLCSTLENELRKHDTETIKRVTGEHDRRVEEKGRLKTQKESVDTKINDLTEEIKNLNSQIKHVENDDGIAQKREIAIECEAAFRDAIDDYVKIMRGKVSKRANHAFSKMTTETGPKELQINERYGLTLHGDNDQKTPLSAGAQQIVAISLIEALNYLGRKKGPMLMDTPFSRLDVSHRKKIMEYLPDVVTQLAIFAHSGEIDKNNIDFDKSKIGARYEIIRETQYHSEIKRISDNG